jgi:uncharacterized protein DUF3800
MYLFYIDESGTRDPDVGMQSNGLPTKDWLYVLTAIGIFEHRWKGFYRVIVRRKRELLARIKAVHGIELDLNATEIKSNWVRIPKEREQHPFLSQLTAPDIEALVEIYFEQLEELSVPVISVLIDKRLLRPPVDAAWLHAKAWELLCERIEMFMNFEHPRHNAIMVADDLGKQQNCALAMRHARFLEQATTAGRRLNHIVEMPLFVRSELSEGVQLADLCGYSTYRAFRDGDMDYCYFKPVFERMYRSRPDGRIDGLKVFPTGSPLRALILPAPENAKGRSIRESDLPLLN